MEIILADLAVDDEGSFLPVNSIPSHLKSKAIIDYIVTQSLQEQRCKKFLPNYLRIKC